MLTHFVLLGEKVTPLPQRNIDSSHVVRSALPDLPTLIDGEGKEYDKSKNLCFLLNNVMP